MIDGVLDKLAGRAQRSRREGLRQRFRRDTARRDRDRAEPVDGAGSRRRHQSTRNRHCRRSASTSIGPRLRATASTSSDVTDLIGTAIGGAPVSQLYIDERRYDIGVRLEPKARDDPDALGRLIADAAPRWCTHRAGARRVDPPRQRREHDHARDEPSPSDGAPRSSRSRSLVVPREAHRTIESRVSYDHSRIDLAWGWPVRESAARAGAPAADHAARAGDHVRAAVRAVRQPAPPGVDPARGCRSAPSAA